MEGVGVGGRRRRLRPSVRPGAGAGAGTASAGAPVGLVEDRGGDDGGVRRRPQERERGTGDALFVSCAEGLLGG